MYWLLKNWKFLILNIIFFLKIQDIYLNIWDLSFLELKEKQVN